MVLDTTPLTGRIAARCPPACGEYPTCQKYDQFTWEEFREAVWIYLKWSAGKTYRRTGNYPHELFDLSQINEGISLLRKEFLPESKYPTFDMLVFHFRGYWHSYPTEWRNRYTVAFVGRHQGHTMNHLYEALPQPEDKKQIASKAISKPQQKRKIGQMVQSGDILPEHTEFQQPVRSLRLKLKAEQNEKELAAEARSPAKKRYQEVINKADKNLERFAAPPSKRKRQEEEVKADENSEEDSVHPAKRRRQEVKVKINENAEEDKISLKVRPRRRLPVKPETKAFSSPSPDSPEPSSIASTPPSEEEKKPKKKRKSAKDGGHDPKGLQEGWNKIARLWLNTKSDKPDAFEAFSFARCPPPNSKIDEVFAIERVPDNQVQKLQKNNAQIDNSSFSDHLHPNEIRVARNNGLSNAQYLCQKRRAFIVDAMRWIQKETIPDLRYDLSKTRAQYCASVDVCRVSNLAENWKRWGMSHVNWFESGVYDRDSTEGHLFEMREWARINHNALYKEFIEEAEEKARLMALHTEEQDKLAEAAGVEEESLD